MDSPERMNVRRRVRLAIATVVATLTVAMAEASAASTGPRAPVPGFLLDRGRYIPLEAPDPRVRIVPIGINNRGEIVGEVIVDNSKDSGFALAGFRAPPLPAECRSSPA
jgi:hypothetical protein